MPVAWLVSLSSGFEATFATKTLGLLWVLNGFKILCNVCKIVQICIIDTCTVVYRIEVIHNYPILDLWCLQVPRAALSVKTLLMQLWACRCSVALWVAHLEKNSFGTTWDHGVRKIAPVLVTAVEFTVDRIRNRWSTSDLGTTWDLDDLGHPWHIIGIIQASPSKHRQKTIVINIQWHRINSIKHIYIYNYIIYIYTGWWFGHVWKMALFFPSYWEVHHPNWLSLHHFSEGLVAQPPTRLLWTIIINHHH